MTLLSFVITALAVARLTRLATSDYLTERPRHWVQAHVPEMVAYLIGCPWCLSMWVAAVIVPVAALWWHVLAVQIVLGVFACSHLTGLLAGLDAPVEYGTTE